MYSPRRPANEAIWAVRPAAWARACRSPQLVPFGRDGAAPPRPGQQAGHRGAQPHAGAVHPRVPADLPPGPAAGRRPRRHEHRPAPAVRRPLRHRRLGRDHHGRLVLRAAVAVPDEQRRFLDEELQELRDKIVRAGEQAITNGEDAKRSSSVKRLQKALLLRKEERVKEKLDKVKDPGVTFEQTGIDYVYRDELHELKNDTITSSIPDAGNDGSDRAVDFRMKLSYLRGQRVVCGATATPIANSVRELYVVTRQLRPDLLQAAGTTDFDTWAATFAKVVTAIEVSPTGQGFQMHARLVRLYRRMATWSAFGQVNCDSGGFPGESRDRLEDRDPFVACHHVAVFIELGSYRCDVGHRMR
jgi:hypothetical protein